VLHGEAQCHAAAERIAEEVDLRDAYGVKLMPVPAFTQGLIDRGIISLGMG
jgi:hypothetical protein